MNDCFRKETREEREREKMSAKQNKRAKVRGKNEREKVSYRKTENLVERMIEIDTKREREKKYIIRNT